MVACLTGSTALETNTHILPTVINHPDRSRIEWHTRANALQWPNTDSDWLGIWGGKLLVACLPSSITPSILFSIEGVTSILKKWNKMGQPCLISILIRQDCLSLSCSTETALPPLSQRKAYCCRVNPLRHKAFTKIKSQCRKPSFGKQGEYCSPTRHW